MAEAGRLGVPMLAQLPIDLNVRLAGDDGTPAAAAAAGPVQQAYRSLATGLIKDGFA